MTGNSWCAGKSLLTRICLASAVVLGNAGCTSEELVDGIIPERERLLAREVVAHIAARDHAAVEARLAEDSRTADVRREIDRLADLIPGTEPESIRTVAAVATWENGMTSRTLTEEYAYSDAWLIVRTRLVSSDDEARVTHVNIRSYDHSPSARRAFTLADKGVLHFVVLALAIAIPLFILSVLVLCIATPLPANKWLWMIFILLGIGQFEFNWTTGAGAFQPIAFSLLGASFLRSGLTEPYILSIALPVGAALFLWKRRTLSVPTDSGLTRRLSGIDASSAQHPLADAERESLGTTSTGDSNAKARFEERRD